MLDFNKDFDFDNTSLSERPTLSPGWHELRLVNIGQERDEKSGKGAGLFCTFAGDNGGSFDAYFCTSVNNSNDSWRVERTEAFFAYIAKISGLEINDLEELLNVPFFALLQEKTIPGRSTVDPVTMEKIDFPERKTVDFGRGALSKILKGKAAPEKRQAAPQYAKQNAPQYGKRQAAPPKPRQVQEIIFDENAGDVPF